MNHIPVRSRGYTATVVAGSFAVLLAQVAYSLPGALNGTFQQEFQTTGAQLTWITAAFAIPMVVFELTTGVIGDLFGRKRLLQAGAALTVVGSLICAVAATVQVMWPGGQGRTRRGHPLSHLAGHDRRARAEQRRPRQGNRTLGWLPVDRCGDLTSHGRGLRRER